MSDLSNATDTPLSLVHAGWDHLRLQRPLAAWACWRRALRLAPDDPAATEALDVLASADELPPAARMEWSFRSPVGIDRQKRWTNAFEGQDLADPERAAEAFATILEEDPDDSAALFNRALCLAWSGRNDEAVFALDQSVTLDAPDRPDQAVTAWSLAEVLRHGAGAERLADDVSSVLQVDWPESQGDPLVAIAGFAPLRVIPVPPDPITGQPVSVSIRLAEWLDPSEDSRSPRVLAQVALAPNSVRFSSPDRPSLELAEEILDEQLGDRFLPTSRWSTPLPLRFLDAAAWLVRVPPDEDDPAAHRSAIEHYYENLWITRPRIGLAGPDGLPRTPAEASRAATNGDLVARVKLTAVISGREALAARTRMTLLAAGYPFDRLRRRLGLPVEDESSVEASDVTCMSREELDQLDPSTLSDDVLAEAIRAARAVCDEATVEKLVNALAERGAPSR